ncbi:MAG: GNAT family N-acetyltransferase [Burkholderiales bacterium]
MSIYGVDFTSAPGKAKPITVVSGRLQGTRLAVDAIECVHDFAAFEAFLGRPGPWTCGFDFPFGLPREAVRALGWPQDWEQLTRHCRRIGRTAFAAASARLRGSRPAGDKYPMRRGDKAAGSHSPMKCVNPPVGWMFLEGASRLADAGVHVPGMRAGDPRRIALEAYPGFIARRVIGRASYKSARAGLLDAPRRKARARLIDGLEADAAALGVSLRLDARLKAQLLAEAAGDLLDAAICALQAAWGWQRRDAGYGMPSAMDPLEGWIVTVQPWKIVAADRTHAAAWTRLRAALFDDLDDAYHAREIEWMLAARNMRAFLALDASGAPAGLLEVSIRNIVDGCPGEDAVGYLEGLYVDPAHRGEGLGRALVDFAAGWFRERGCRHIATDTGIENTAAQRLYEHLGFARKWTVVQFLKPL